jgi:release factor glutamine methyltransferase
MNWFAAEKQLTENLRSIYPEGEATSISDWMMEAITGGNKAHRRLHKTTPLSVAQEHLFEEYQKRLLQHEPVQYILQQAWFYGLALYVDKTVLIPRPETEELVQWVVDDLSREKSPALLRSEGEADLTTELKIMDVCTGSGCIALALKKALPRAEVWGCDVGEEALNVARRNGATLDIRVDFQGLDFLDEAQQRRLPTVDVIVSNPPYVPQHDAADMQPNVLQYEPHLALFVPTNDALQFYKALAQFGKKRLYAGGKMYLEVHEQLAGAVAQLFEEAGYVNAVIKTDMQGKQRMVRVNAKA